MFVTERGLAVQLDFLNSSGEHNGIDEFPAACRLCEDAPQRENFASESDNDSALMLRLRHGDVAALEKLVERHKRQVVNTAARMLGDWSEAEDITQNVFIQACRAAPRFHFRCKASTWLITITRNLCLNELRRRARHRTTSLHHHPDDDTCESRRLRDEKGYCCPSSTTLKAELMEKIEEALAALPERQRTAILLIREENFSYQEIASIMGTTLPATKALIHCGRKELKQKLLPYLHSGIWPGSNTGAEKPQRAPNRFFSP